MPTIMTGMPTAAAAGERHDELQDAGRQRIVPPPGCRGNDQDDGGENCGHRQGHLRGRVGNGRHGQVAAEAGVECAQRPQTLRHDQWVVLAQMAKDVLTVCPGGDQLEALVDGTDVGAPFDRASQKNLHQQEHRRENRQQDQEPGYFGEIVISARGARQAETAPRAVRSRGLPPG
jgi:hypothetical protein